MKIKLPFGIEVNANGRSVVLVLIALVLIALLSWHHVSSDALGQATNEAIWFQTIVLAAPQEERKKLLELGSAKAPPSIREKIITNALAIPKEAK